MSGSLTFDRAGVLARLAHSEGSSKWKESYEGDQEPGLWLVGDQGVYLMSNGDPGERTGKDSLAVVYARECDPRGNFDEWWAVKRATFGGDDGCEFIPAETFHAFRAYGVGDLTLTFKGTAIEFSWRKHKAVQS